MALWLAGGALALLLLAGAAIAVMTALERRSDPDEADQPDPGVAGLFDPDTELAPGEEPEGSLLFPTVPREVRDELTLPLPGPVPRPVGEEPRLPGRAGTIVLTGRAYDRDTQEGIPGVEILLTVFGGEGSGLLLGPQPIEAVTGPEGAFHTEVATVTPSSPGAPVSVMFHVGHAEGGRVYTGPGTPIPGGAWMMRTRLRDGELRLNLPFRPGLPLAGRVLMPDSRTPAADVTVEASTSAGSEHSYRAGTQTGEEGHFELRLPPNSIGHLAAESPDGAARTSFRMPGEGAHHDVVLVLTEFGTLEGRVTDPEGRPAAGSTISATSEPATGGRVTRTVESGEEGEFTLERVPAGDVELRARPPEDSRWFESEAISFSLDVGEARRGIVVELREGDSVPVRVVSASDESPLSGATVRAEIRGVPGATEGRTDEDGRFSMEGIPPGGRLALLGVNHATHQESFRQDISPLDGEQLFRLEPLHHRELIVRWEEDRSPVAHYSYIMLRKGWNRFDIDMQRGNQVVQSEDGRTTIGNLSEGEWRVEVVHLTESGEPTAVRGSAEFEVAAGTEDGEPVEVLLSDQLAIEGVVRQADTGEPVGGARVEIVPPARHDPVYYWSQPQPAERHVEGVATDTSGHFEISGLTAGDHTLTVKHGAYRNRDPIDVRVYPGEEPEFVEIEIERGGVIHGRVIDSQGEPYAGASITHMAPNPNHTQWERSTHTTDPQGRFRMDGLPAGPHTVILEEDGERIARDRRALTLEFGEEKEVEFDFHNLIRVYGDVEITAGGAPPSGDIRLTFNARQDGSTTTTADVIPETMEYEARLRPGQYSITANIPPHTIRGEGQTIQVSESPAEQRHNVSIDYAEADVVLVFPADGDFTPGLTMVAPEERHRRFGFVRVRMEQEARRTVHLMAGTYNATFTSEDGSWRGESGPVEIGEGQENIFVLEMKRLQRNIRIGTWDPASISLQAQPQLYDASQFIRSDGTVDILVEYERGRNGVITEWAHLYEDGEIVSTDRHEGWTGFEHWNNVYRLHLDGYDPNAVYHVEVGLRGEGGVDSFGSVFLSTN